MMLSDRTRLLSPPGTSKMRVIANELKAAGVDVVNFAAGELDIDTSPTVKSAAKAAIDAGHNIYTPTLGLPGLRKLVAELVSRQCGTPYQDTEVGVTAGAKQALFNAALVLVNPGDEVIIPQPYWVTFPSQVELAGGRPVFIDTRRSGYRLLAADVERAVTAKTKAIVINTPNNPTGTIYDADELRRIADLALQHDFWIIFDECYASLVRSGHEHSNIVALRPEEKDRVVVVNSFSKSQALTGWRVGYVAAPAPVIKAMENLQGHTTSNPNSVAQYAVMAALREGMAPFIDAANRLLDERLRHALHIVHEMAGIKAAPAEGAFYLFLDIQSKLGKSFRGQQVKDVDALCELALAHANVAVVSGAAFGDPTGIRVSYAIKSEDVTKGLLRLQRFFAEIE